MKLRWDTLKQVLFEFAPACLLATLWASYSVWQTGGGVVSFGSHFGGAFIFVYFFTAALNRVHRQQGMDEKLHRLRDEIRAVTVTTTALNAVVKTLREAEDGEGEPKEIEAAAQLQPVLDLAAKAETQMTRVNTSLSYLASEFYEMQRTHFKYFGRHVEHN